MPSFWLALILLTAFAVNIPIFNVIADGSIKSLILPSVAMAIPIICISTRVLRASVLNELKSDYVAYARARGFSNSQIVFGEVLRNALPAAITLLLNIVLHFLEHLLWLKVYFLLTDLEST